MNTEGKNKLSRPLEGSALEVFCVKNTAAAFMVSPDKLWRIIRMSLADASVRIKKNEIFFVCVFRLKIRQTDKNLKISKMGKFFMVVITGDSLWVIYR